MRILILIAVFVFCIFASSAQACLSLPLSDVEAKKLTEEAYYIGLVRGEYIEQYPRGALKEVRLKPFAVYVSAPDINLKDMIVLTGDGSSTSCDADIPKKYEIAEVLIIKQNGQLKLKRTDVLMPDYIHSLRNKMRYVGEE